MFFNKISCRFQSDFPKTIFKIINYVSNFFKIHKLFEISIITTKLAKYSPFLATDQITRSSQLPTPRLLDYCEKDETYMKPNIRTKVLSASMNSDGLNMGLIN